MKKGGNIKNEKLTSSFHLEQSQESLLAASNIHWNMSYKLHLQTSNALINFNTQFQIPDFKLQTRIANFKSQMNLKIRRNFDLKLPQRHRSQTSTTKFNAEQNIKL